MVTIDGGALTQPVVVAVMPQQVVMQTLPWVDLLKRCNIFVAIWMCHRKRSCQARCVSHSFNQPITVYQFSPIDYQLNGSLAYTNDASLLLPTNAWTGNYLVATYQAWQFSSANLPQASSQ